MALLNKYKLEYSARQLFKKLFYEDSRNVCFSLES